MNTAFRIQEHNKAQAAMNAGNYFESIEILHAAQNKYGPHVGLISDLVACLYLTGRHYDSYQIFQNLIKEFNFCKNSLSNTTQINTLILMSKMHEEFGEIQESIYTLEQAKNLSLLKAEYQERIFSNLLRVYSSYGYVKNLGPLYLTCINNHNLNPNINFEMQHSLILSELNLFGIETAKCRVEKTLASPQTLAWQKRLLIFDLVDFSITNNTQFLWTNELALYKESNDLTDYEATILGHIYKTQFFGTHEESLMMQLRSLKTQLCSKSNAECIEINKKINFLIENLKHENKKIINKWLKIQHLPVQNQNSIQYINGNFTFNNQILEFKYKGLFAYLFDHLKKQRAISLEKICLEFYQEDFDLYKYDRIRLAVKRINEKLKITTGINNILKVKKNSVEIENETIIFK